MYVISYSTGLLDKGYIKNLDETTKVFDTLKEAQEFVKGNPRLTIERCKVK